MTALFARRSGQAVIEAALMLPLILLLVLGVVAIGLVGRTDAALLAVAEEGARAAVTSTSAIEAAAHGVAAASFARCGSCRVFRRAWSMR